MPSSPTRTTGKRSRLRRRLRPLLLALLLATTNGCMKDANHTELKGLADPACRGTEQGNSCLTLRFSASDWVRNHASLKGDLEWSIYHDGDVGPLGPGDHESVTGDEYDDVDLSDKDSFVDVTIPNLSPGSYQALGFLDLNGNDKDDSGEPVTLPRDGFEVPADTHVVAQVTLDYIR